MVSPTTNEGSPIITMKYGAGYLNGSVEEEEKPDGYGKIL
jgi:hypothetical protein